MFVGPQYGTCFMSPFWHLEFRGGCQIFGKFVDLLCNTVLESNGYIHVVLF
jgi:hypothetical protein